MHFNRGLSTSDRYLWSVKVSSLSTIFSENKETIKSFQQYDHFIYRPFPLFTRPSSSLLFESILQEIVVILPLIHVINECNKHVEIDTEENRRMEIDEL